VPVKTSASGEGRKEGGRKGGKEGVRRMLLAFLEPQGWEEPLILREGGREGGREGRKRGREGGRAN